MPGLQKVGGLAALYMAASYALGIVIFLVVLDYPHITDSAQKIALLVDQPGMIFTTNLILFVVFGIALILFVMALHDRLKAETPVMANFASVVGIIWAGSLIASGMVANAGIGPAVRLFGTDPAQAALIWAQTETVASGLGNGDGEILGGLMTLVYSWAGMMGKSMPRPLGYLGMAVGLVGIASIMPGLTDLTAVFGITQLLWFAAVAVVLLRGTPDGLTGTGARVRAR